VKDAQAAGREGEDGAGPLDDLAACLAGTRRQQPWDKEQVRVLWRRLLEGRSRLAASFERDGRRYYVIRDVCATVTAPASLDEREQRLAELLGSGESEKAAAYALGVTPSTVSASLKTALAKLGLGSRGDLVFLVRSLRVAAAA
jgi:DNA-binding NarL/FixJ family response regulator